MILQRVRFFLVIVVLVPAMSWSQTIQDYAKESREQIRNTQKKLEASSGLFSSPSHRGTTIRRIDTNEQRKPSSQSAEYGD